MYSGAPRRRGKGGEDGLSSQNLAGVLAGGLLCGFLLGYAVMETSDVMFKTGTRRALSTALHSAESRLHMHRHQLGNPVGGQQAGGSVAGGHVGGMHVVSNPVATTPTVVTTTSQPVAVQVAAKPVETKPAASTASRPAGDTIHSVITSSGSAYQNFQGRIMYGTYLLVQKMPGGEKLTGFTRVLHRVKEDELMNEIPTFHAKPLHPECDVWCDFPVADRPNAVRQWMASVDANPSLMKGAWVLLLECDYVWMKPMQAPDAYNPANAGLQFHFGYIMSQHPDCAHIIKRLYGGGDVNDVPNSGPAPVLIRYSDFQKVAPDWEKVTAAIEADPEAVKVLGWVREMYAWDIALAMHKDVKMVTEEPVVTKLIVQPPADQTFGNAAMAHYTWGAIYHKAKNFSDEVFRWEKRDFTAPEHALKVPLLKLPPQPFVEGEWVLQDKVPVSAVLHQTLTQMLTQMNRAIEKLPDLSNAAFKA